MPEEKGSGSMFKTVEEHEKAINDNILPRLEILEKEHLDFKQEMSSLKTDIAGLKTDMAGMQKGQKELEVTVMKDGKETRDLLKPFADHALKQMEYDAQTEREIAIKKLDNKDKATVALYGAIGSGGLVTIIAAVIAIFK